MDGSNPQGLGPQVGGQEQTGTSASANAPINPPASNQPSNAGIDLIFREFMYRCCRDSLFWIEAERYRLNSTMQKATFILRTFFSENAEFCLSREDFPTQFDPLFSKNRPTSPQQLILEAQDQMKGKLIALLGPSFSQSPLLKAYMGNPAQTLASLNHQAGSGSLQALLVPRASQIMPQSPVGSPGPTASPHIAPIVTPTILTNSNNQFPPRPTTGMVQPAVSTPSGATFAATSPTRLTSSNSGVLAPPSASSDGESRFISPIGGNRTRAMAGVSLHPTENINLSSSTDKSVSSPDKPVSSPDKLVLPTEKLASSSDRAVTPPANLEVSNNSTSSTSPIPFTVMATTSIPISPLASKSAANLSTSPDWDSPFVFASLSPRGGVDKTPPPKNITPPPMSSSTSPNPTSTAPAGLFAPSSTSILPSTTTVTPTPTRAPFLARDSASDLTRRPSRGSLADGTLTSAQLNKIAPAPGTKAASSTAKVTVTARDKVGAARREKERKEREKYFDVAVNSWIFMDHPNLDDLIHDTQMMILFYDYLKTIHAEENFLCWLEIELYKACVAPRDSRKNLGIDLLVRFFEPSSKSLINIEGVDYKQILKELNEKPSRDLFDRAQASLWDQLAYQCYSRFKDSEVVKRLYEEPSIKNKKKELTKQAQKAAKASTDNANFLQKLEEFSRFRTGYVPFIPNVSEREFQLEDILYSSDLLTAFREYLNTLNNRAEYLDALNFWFDVEVWKYSPKENAVQAANQIFKDYLLPSANSTAPKVALLGLDLKEMEKEFGGATVDRAAFLRVQTFVWRKLKLEQFTNFENSDTLAKFFEGNLPMRQNLQILKNCELLNEMRARNMNEQMFKTNLAKVTGKVRLKRQELQGLSFDLEFMLTDKEYVSILCEFLDKRQARENLAFWVEAEYWKYLQPSEKVGGAKNIWERFFSDKADININVDLTEKTVIQQALKGKELPDNLFFACQEQIYGLLSYDLIPKFTGSEQGVRLLKAAKKKPVGMVPISIFAAGSQGIKDLRVWVTPTNI